MIDGSARSIDRMAGVLRLLQTGRLYWYALVMMLGIVVLMTWMLWPHLALLLGH